MYPSASLCREQESLQRDRAASAWCIEAVAAEKREARHERTRLIAAQQHGEPTNAVAGEGFDEDDERGLSEA